MQDIPSALRLYLRSSSTWMLVSGRKSSGARLAGRSRLANTRDRMRMEAKSPVRKMQNKTVPRERREAGTPPWQNHCHCGERWGGMAPPEAEIAILFVELLGPGCKLQADTPPQGLVW